MVRAMSKRSTQQPTRTLRLVGYTRVSTESQVDSESLPAQRALLRAWAKANGHRLGAIYEDAGVSGSNGLEARPGLYDSLEAITSGTADGMVVKDLSRFARRLTVQEAVLAKVWDRGAVVYSIEDGGAVMEDDPDDPMRTAMRQMRGVFAELDRGMIVKRMKDGRKHKADRGGYAGYGSPPFGWCSQGGELVEVAHEQEALVLMRALHCQNESTTRIAHLLNEAGHAAKRGGVWSSATVSRVLTRPLSPRHR